MNGAYDLQYLTVATVTKVVYYVCRPYKVRYRQMGCMYVCATDEVSMPTTK